MTQEMNTVTAEDYYKEQDPLKRGEILRILEEREPGEENRLRRAIYDRRYACKSQRNDGELADGYIGLWMSMRLLADKSRGFLGKKSLRKELVKQMDRLGIPAFMDQGELARELLFDEFYHMAALYIHISLTDRSYGSTFLGMMPLKEEQLHAKLSDEVSRIAYEIPANLGMEEEFSIFTRAVADAFTDALPGFQRDFRERAERFRRS